MLKLCEVASGVMNAADSDLWPISTGVTSITDQKCEETASEALAK